MQVGGQPAVSQRRREAIRVAERFGEVDARADEFLLRVVIGDPVAVVQCLVCAYVEMRASELDDLADLLADELGRVEGADVDMALVHEIVGRTAIEGLFRLRREQEGAAPRRAALVRRKAGQNRVELLPVVRRDVLHVGQVLQPTLDLERADAGRDQRAQVGALVVVLQGQQVLVLGDDLTVLIGERVGQAAGLRAVAAVGAAPGLRVADVAQAAVADAQRAVDEELKRGRGVFGDLADLFQRQLACQHHLRETDGFEKTRLLDRADVGLRAGVQFDRRQIEFKQAHVLHDQRVGAGFVNLPDEAARFFQFLVLEDRVQRDQYACVVAMREGCEPLDVADGIAGIGARAESRAADIHRVGAMNDRFHAEIGVFCRGEQFECVSFGHQVDRG